MLLDPHDSWRRLLVPLAPTQNAGNELSLPASWVEHARRRDRRTAAEELVDHEVNEPGGCGDVAFHGCRGSGGQSKWKDASDDTSYSDDLVRTPMLSALEAARVHFGHP